MVDVFDGNHEWLEWIRSGQGTLKVLVIHQLRRMDTMQAKELLNEFPEMDDMIKWSFHYYSAGLPGARSTWQEFQGQSLAPAFSAGLQHNRVGAGVLQVALVITLPDAERKSRGRPALLKSLTSKQDKAGTVPARNRIADRVLNVNISPTTEPCTDDIGGAGGRGAVAASAPPMPATIAAVAHTATVVGNMFTAPPDQPRRGLLPPVLAADDEDEGMFIRFQPVGRTE